MQKCFISIPDLTAVIPFNLFSKKISFFYPPKYSLVLQAMKCLLSHWSAAASCVQVLEPMLFKVQLLLIEVSMTDKPLLHTSLFYPWDIS